MGLMKVLAICQGDGVQGSSSTCEGVRPMTMELESPLVT